MTTDYQALIEEAWHYVNDWRNDDQECRIPDNDFGQDLALSIDLLLEVAKGPLMPREVTTAEELEALPRLSIVKPVDSGTCIQRLILGEPAGLEWFAIGDPMPGTAHSIRLPATVLFTREGEEKP